MVRNICIRIYKNADMWSASERPTKKGIIHLMHYAEFIYFACSALFYLSICH